MQGNIVPPPLRELAAGTSALLWYAHFRLSDLLQSGCFGCAALVYIWSGLAFALQIRWEGLTLCFWGFGDFFLLPLPLSYFSMISPAGSGWSVWDPGRAPECSISSACNIDCIVYSVTGLLGSRKTFYKTDLSPLSTLTASEMNKKPTSGKPPGMSWAENVPGYILSHCSLLTLTGDQCQLY